MTDDRHRSWPDPREFETQPEIAAPTDRVRARRRRSSIGDLDRVALLLGALQSIPGVVLPREREEAARREIVAFAGAGLEQCRRATARQLAERDETIADLRARLEQCRRRDTSIRLAILAYGRDEIGWPELMGRLSETG